MKRRELIKRGGLLAPIATGLLTSDDQPKGERDVDEFMGEVFGHDRLDSPPGPTADNLAPPKVQLYADVVESAPENAHVIDPKKYNLRETKPFDEILPKVPGAEVGQKFVLASGEYGLAKELSQQIGYDGPGPRNDMFRGKYLNVDGKIIQTHVASSLVARFEADQDD